MTKIAPWMHGERERAKEREAEAKAARKTRGSRVFAVLPWQGDGRYDAADALAWFRTEKAAEKYAIDFRGLGGRGLVVREWTYLRNADAPLRERTAAELDREIAEMLRRAGY